MINSKGTSSRPLFQALRLLLCALLLISLLPQGVLAASNNPEGEYVGGLPAPGVSQDDMANNYGTIGSLYSNGTVFNNSGTINSSAGTVHTNNGTIINHIAGTVITNNGTIKHISNTATLTTNATSGTVEVNAPGGTITRNDGIVANNSATVTVNKGTITANHGLVSDHLGTIITNEERGTVNITNTNPKIYPYIETNAGTVQVTGGNLELLNNTGTVTLKNASL